jgi:hypothetical protein
MKKIWLWCLIAGTSAFAQGPESYTLSFEPVPIPEMVGVQSFSYARSGDEILIMGGRLDGLHQRMPNASFDAAGHNDQLIVLNVATKQVWKTKVTESALDLDLSEQLKATNHCFYQHKDSLMLIGGYGIRTSADDHATFTTALYFSVPDVIAAVKANQLTNSLFERFESDQFAVCGGQLNRIDNTWYLVGGHRFDGRYNPRNGPSFVQAYSSEVRMFEWKHGKPHFLKHVKDEELLHKRDYNLVKIPVAIGGYELLALSGVFQVDFDLPFQTTTRIAVDGSASLQANFRQFYNHYECPEIVVYDPTTKTSHLFMMGGIAQYYDTLGIPLQDDNVPFVSTLTRLSVLPNGKMEEWLLAGSMPELLGAGSAFVSNKGVSWDANIYHWDTTDPQSIDMGYLIGGIVPKARNVFWINEGMESKAVSTVYRVRLIKTDTKPRLNTYASNPLNVELLKHGKKDRYMVFFDLQEDAPVTVTFTDPNGKVFHQKTKKFKKGTNYWKTFLPKEIGVYRVKVETEQNGWKQEWDQFIFVDE